MRYSVVIPSYNEGERLAQTVRSIISTATCQTEIVVVDDGSDDRSADALRNIRTRRHVVRVLRNPKRSGVAVSRANGMDAAHGDWLLCIDAHNRFPRRWQQAIEDAARQLDGGYGYLLGPELQYGHYYLTGTYYPAPDLYPVQLPQQVASKPYQAMSLPGACHVIRRDYYHDIGGYDRCMLPPWGGEDMELSLRVWMLGGECRIVPGFIMHTALKESFEYPMRFETTIGNVLRVAHIYLDDQRLEQHIETQVGHPAYQRAEQLVRAAGTKDRRHELEACFNRTIDDLFELFEIKWWCSQWEH